MYKLIATIKNEPKLDYIYTNCKDIARDCGYICTQPNVEVNNYDEFKKKFIDDLLEKERVDIENRKDDYEDESEYKNEERYKYSLEYLGEEKYIERVEKIMCRELHGSWTDYYILLDPLYNKNYDKYAHVQFDKTPSIMELLYTHCKVWQEYYHKMNYDISRIDHHYSLVDIKGDENQLIVYVRCAS